MVKKPLKYNLYYSNKSEYRPTPTDFGEDFNDFHLPLAQFHHTSLHKVGIAEGLEVSGTIGGTTIVIEAGLAVDGEGHLITLAEEGKGNIGENPSERKDNEVEVPVTLDVTGHVGERVYVTIEFAEIQRLNGSSDRPRRMEQVPWLRLQPVAGPPDSIVSKIAVVLAIVDVDADGKVAAIKAQDDALPYARRGLSAGLGTVHFQRSGAVGEQLQELPAAQVSARAAGGLEFSVPQTSDDGTKWRSSLSINEQGNIGIGTTSPGAELDIRGQLKTSRLSFTDADGTIYPDNWIGMTDNIIEETTKWLHIGGITDGGVRRLTLWADKTYITGNVGIGTPHPGAKLSVNGAAATVDIGTTEILRLTRPVVTDVKNSNSAGLFVGAFEQGIAGRSRLEVKLAGAPVEKNLWGAIPDTTVMTLDATGDVEIAKNLLVKGTLNFPSDPGGGAGDAASIRYYARTGEATTLEIRVSHDLDDHIALMPSGNVGIGTANPQARLDVQGDIRAGTSDIYFTGINHKHTGIGNTPGYAAIENAADYDALMILGRTGTSRGRYVRLWDYLQVNGSMDVTGNLGIGTTTPEEKLHVAGAFVKVNGAGNEQAYIGGDGSANDVQIGSCNPSVTSVAMWNTMTGWMNLTCKKLIEKSDQRGKENILQISDALSKVMQLRGVTYDWRQAELQERHLRESRQMGLIAQEVEKVLPEAVVQDNRGSYGITYSSIIPILVEAIKEQQQVVEKLQVKVTEVLGQIGRQHERSTTIPARNPA